MPKNKSMLKILIVANWKMNPKSPIEAKRLFEGVQRGTKNVKNVEVVICAPFVHLCLMQPPLNPPLTKGGGGVRIGAQDCFWEQKGAFTGEVSPIILKNVGCEYVIIGHSERRQYFGETNETINLKLKAALAAGLKPILCIGEKEEEREYFKDILVRQLAMGLRDLNARQLSVLSIAYEPVWAISTSGGHHDCSPEDAFSAYLMIKKFLITKYGKSVAERIRIIYGGSVDSKNAAFYIKEAKMEGLLVGGASLNINEFTKIITTIEK